MRTAMSGLVFRAAVGLVASTVAGGLAPLNASAEPVPLASAALMEPYAGSWFRHGETLQVYENGLAVLEARTYECSPAVTVQPCDTMWGEAVEVLNFTDVSPTGMSGTVLSAATNDPGPVDPIGAPATLTPNMYKELILSIGGQNTTWCGNQSAGDPDTGACGA